MAEGHVGRGRSFPLGGRLSRDGANFSVYSKHAQAMELLLFEGAEDARPSRVIRLEPGVHRTYHYWHVFVPGVRAGQVYGWRASGPRDPSRGLRFDPEKVLLDPYGLGLVVPPGYDRGAACRPGDTSSSAIKSVVVDLRAYDWQGDAPRRRPWHQTIIYELHVAGFTKDPSSGVSPGRRGTYAGLVEKIDYLKALGVTAVELLPVFQFDPQDAPPGKSNYWGYAPVSFFAPHAGYSSRADPLGPLDEFRDLVKALHRAGLEVILDVVFNHTAEGDEHGPTFCYRGLANEDYYILGDDRQSYANYTGTGNTLNANDTVTRRMILDSLRYWVEVMHVDGFRFDLASVLSRDERGRPLANPPLLWDIESDPVLANAKMIAEAWDPGGLYQVGRFVGDSWKEWNGVFRDDVRRFLRGDRGTVSRLPARLLASPDLYEHEEREPEQSVNFVTCHDGFTLNDLVSYNSKHNEANGEGNRDGTDENLSWNCGAEGPSDEPAVERLRARQAKNLLTLTLLSMGTPMILMGDEVRRTQGGNNNAYCQDNPTSWFDWTLTGRQEGLLRFTRTLVRHRLRGLWNRDGDLTLSEVLRKMRLAWHGIRLNQPDWGDGSHALAFTLTPPEAGYRMHAMLNAYWEPLDFELPSASDAPWRRWVDTSLEPPDDIAEWPVPAEVRTPAYRVESRSIVVLVGGRG